MASDKTVSLGRQFAKLRALFAGRTPVDDLRDEVRAHLRIAEQENLESGMSLEEAHYEALRRFGNVRLVEQRSREMWTWDSLESLMQDVRYGLRMLRRSPGFTAVAVCTLALGIGATTMIFGALNATLWRPLPFRDPGRLLMVWGTGAETGGFGHFSAPDYFDWKSHNSIFTSIAAYSEADPEGVAVGNQHFRTRAVSASSNLFATLGVGPALGSPPAALDDSVAGRDAMISFHLWHDRFGTRSDVIGSQIMVNRQAYRIVAVLPADFPLPLVDSQHYEIILPLAASGAGFAHRATRDLHLLGRLRPGVSVDQAQAATAAFGSELARTYPEVHRHESARVAPLGEAQDDLRSPLWILFGAVVFLLLVACGNVASLLLARGLARRKEFSVRAALGASRRRIVRQLLAESLLLASFGGVFGFLLAEWGTRALAALGASAIPQLARVTVDVRAAVFAALVTISAVFIFGLLPALEVSRVDLQQSMKETGPSATLSSRHLRLRNLLVSVQVALAVTVLCGAGLLLRSFYDLILTNPGLRVENLALADLSKTTGPAAQIAFYDDLLGRVRRVPGVQFAGLASSIPLGSDAVAPMPPISVPGASIAHPPDAMTRVVTPAYFGAAGIPIVEGRDFTAADSPAAERVAVVNKLVVKRLFPDGHGVGREIEILRNNMNTVFPVQPGVVRIVGVIGDVMHWFTGGDPHLDNEVYLPYAQSPIGDMTLVVRPSGPTPLLTGDLTSQINAADPEALIGSVTTMQRELSDTVAPRRFYPAFVTAFALVALLLAAAGIYGVLAHLVRQRSHEIGIRLVLGARPADVVLRVLSQGLRPALIGAALGLVAALGLTRFLVSLLYGVHPTDPVSFVMAALLLAAVASVASYIPARRATKVDPAVALRYE